MTIIEAPLLKPFTAVALTSSEVRMRMKRNEFWSPRGSRGDAFEGDWVAEGAIEIENPAHHAGSRGSRHSRSTDPTESAVKHPPARLLAGRLGTCQGPSDRQAVVRSPTSTEGGNPVAVDAVRVPGQTAYLEAAADKLGQPELARRAGRLVALTALANLCAQASRANPADVAPILAKAGEFRDQLAIALEAADAMLTEVESTTTLAPDISPIEIPTAEQPSSGEPEPANACGPAEREAIMIAYATDEDLAIRAPADFLALCPKDQVVAAGADGLFLPDDPWTLRSPSVNFAGAGASPGRSSG